MPCYTKIATKLIDLRFVEAAAKNLGIEISKRTANVYTLKKGYEHLTLERTKEGEAFFVQAYSGSNNILEEIVSPLTAEYTKAVTVDFYKRKGYTVSSGQKPGELIFTKYS